jgi:hypothetical protein
MSGAIQAVVTWYVYMIMFHLPWQTGESRILNYASEKHEKIFLFSAAVTSVDYSVTVQRMHT